MNDITIQVIGWIPAFIFPMAAALQLFKIYSKKRADGVSALAWFAFGIANLSLYVYTEKYYELQTIFGMVGQAMIDFTIAGYTVYCNKRVQNLIEGEV